MKWREEGMNAQDAIRYPVGRAHVSKCVCSYKDNNFDKPLNYVEARKEIYFGDYVALVKQQPLYKKLEDMLNSGKNLLIIEVDGPIQNSLEYYKEKYKIPKNWIERNSIDITEKNMKILINDTKHAFGHGYCLAMALLDIGIGDM
jgi:hypothetical protein